MFSLELLITACAIIASLATAYFSLVGKISKVVEQNDALLHMHEHPEGTGFGTIGHREAFEENTRAVRQLAHYLRWFIKSQSGTEPPPPLDL